MSNKKEKYNEDDFFIVLVVLYWFVLFAILSLFIIWFFTPNVRYEVEYKKCNTNNTWSIICDVNEVFYWKPQIVTYKRALPVLICGNENKVLNVCEITSMVKKR